MDAVPTQRPLGLRVLNAVGGALRAAGVPLLRLDADRLMATAAKRTGLGDFGDDWFRDPLRRLLASLEGEAQLTTLGRLIARTDVVRLLENRLRMVHAWTQHPEILAGPVARPLFIVGLPRTGTTILHALLAQDPQNRVPMTWEVMHPWPAPERATYDSDARIAQVDHHFSRIDQVLPGFQAVHPMGAQLPQECVALMAHEFATMIYHTTNNVPSYQAWLEAADLRPLYASHRRQLQYLQWRCPAERWALKSPAHLWAPDALFAEYPDARIIHTHRDPLRVLASLTSLIATLRGMATEAIDPHAIAADWTERLALGLRRTMERRDRGVPAGVRIFDMHYRDFVGHEIEMVQRIYAAFDLTLTPVAEGRMRDFLTRNPSSKHGVHRYTLAYTGLDADAERQRYAFYQERYGVESEPV